jgi:hypothetical protein
MVAWNGENAAELRLPGADLIVEFAVDPVWRGQDDGSDMSETGMALYMATDAVRFLRHSNREAIALVDVPDLTFSEVMRDVDLFVGVASVGADPTWYDRGPEGHRRYWRDYSFGELSASGQVRRAILERLLPRLAIAPRCAFDDRFLVVRGDLRTYRIHLGSGNIQMEPNNQYLCIVPARGTASPVFLPFEGDHGLAVILSKALLLANDRAITDPTITRQIGVPVAGR